MDAAGRSPWWYRNRGAVIGLLYGAGFFAGNVSFDGVPPAPSFAVWGQPGGAAGVHALAWLGVALTVLAWLIRSSGTAYLRREVVFAADALQDRLLVAGPFRYVRNPLYLGNIVLAVGVGLYAPPLGFAIIVVGNVAFVIALAREEAAQLARRYGAAFEAYRRAVPAFVPRMTPADVPGSIAPTPSLSSALLGEAGIGLIAIALLPVALFGQAGVPALLVLIVASLLVSFGVNRITNRRVAGATTTRD
jgi:protein-S-isoprenylcysteine O-methyltransferase Ste14